jgi:YVTN family beta-propeller protein
VYVCNRFNNDVSVIDLAAKREVRRIGVPREPISTTITPEGKQLLVADHLHAGRADVDVVAASVRVIDLVAGKVVQEIALPSGCTLLRDIRISPDGRYAVMAHVLARFHMPITQVERGWINIRTAPLSVKYLKKILDKGEHHVG